MDEPFSHNGPTPMKHRSKAFAWTAAVVFVLLMIAGIIVEAIGTFGTSKTSVNGSLSSLRIGLIGGFVLCLLQAISLVRAHQWKSIRLWVSMLLMAIAAMVLVTAWSVV